jgi:hypothetical protein
MSFDVLELYSSSSSGSSGTHTLDAGRGGGSSLDQTLMYRASKLAFRPVDEQATCRFTPTILPMMSLMCLPCSVVVRFALIYRSCLSRIAVFIPLR